VIPFDLVCGGVNAQHNMNYVTDHICMYLKYMTTFDNNKNEENKKWREF
jgi:hypothetical protein